ncbi:MAG: hypothetical protein BGO14_00690 [Chlamydiales bacterium 38-26]|nr:NAD(P)/FAD-dependent oxidoreductase [Chlamydiales bacterium]OJV07239.1 MAG: hypothetical protein BGO14_00690 [Chlamydiales bacterium 38-26]
MQSSYDAIVVGAGPAGGQCARELAKNGKKVLLVEKSKDFSVNNYSSGGAPAEMLGDYSLPRDVLGTMWNKIALFTSTQRHYWGDEKYAGVVFDFMKLRAFLAQEVTQQGSELLLDHSYHHHEVDHGKTYVYLRNMHKQDILKVEAAVIVDATGAERKVLQNGKFEKKEAVAATGVEYLVEVKSEDYQRYAKTLSFFLGLKWMPQGYAWIFPMEENRLKIGVVRYFAHDMVVPHELSYRHYIERMLKECLQGDAKILDTHGKTMYYFEGQNEPRYEGNIVAIGDAISTLNPMASEGIRHAMYSGRMAARRIVDYLKGDNQSFFKYSKEMDKYFGFRWKTSEYLMNCMYRETKDEQLERYAQSFKKLSFDEMLQFTFQYKLKTVAKFFWNYFILDFGKKS